MRRSNFTLVEVLLALGVVVIGICSIMVLFPVGSNAMRDASLETYASNSIEELLSCLKYQLKNETDWNSVLSDFPEMDTEASVQERFRKSGDNDANLDLRDKESWGDNYFNKKGYFVKNKSFKNVYQLIAFKGDDSDDEKKVDKDENIDFRALARIAKQKVKINNLEINNYDKAVTLNVEISWPAEIPYESRQKAYYSMDIFKSN